MCKSFISFSHLMSVFFLLNSGTSTVICINKFSSKSVFIPKELDLVSVPGFLDAAA